LANRVRNFFISSSNFYWSPLFLLVLFYSSVQLTNHAWVKNIKTPTIWNFPMWKVYIFLPIGMGIMVLQYLADILSIIYKYENAEGN